MSSDEVIQMFIKNQDERHKENLDKFDILFEKLDDVSCGVISQRVDSIEKNINLLTLLVVTVLIGGIVLGVWMKNIGG